MWGIFQSLETLCNREIFQFIFFTSQFDISSGLKISNFVFDCFSVSSPILCEEIFCLFVSLYLKDAGSNSGSCCLLIDVTQLSKAICIPYITWSVAFCPEEREVCS